MYLSKICIMYKFRPKISIITVCFNAADVIEQTMLSVLNQTYDNVEYIIIDGGSTDGTIDIINKYSNLLSYWVSEPDRGIYDAMNKGIKISTGDYINFMNAGDKFVDNEIVNNVVSKLNSDIDVIFGDCYYIHQNKKYQIKQYIEAKNISTIIKKYPFCHQSTFTKVDYIKNHPFDISFKICADWYFFRNAYINDKIKFNHIPIAICDFDISEGMSRDNLDILFYERYRCMGIDKSFLRQIPYEFLRILIHVKNNIKHCINIRIKKSN